jgi:uncharacterized protein YkwD
MFSFLLVLFYASIVHANYDLRPTTGHGPPSRKPGQVRFDPKTMLCLINAERAKIGESPLGFSKRLMKAAQFQSDHQASVAKTTHVDKQGRKVGPRVEGFGYDWMSVAENVAYGFKNEQALVDALFKSAKHKKNMLSKQATMFGVGMAVSTKNGKPYYTQVFASDGRPASDIPDCGLPHVLIICCHRV